jgi:hypothetical protein
MKERKSLKGIIVRNEYITNEHQRFVRISQLIGIVLVFILGFIDERLRPFIFGFLLGWVVTRGVME